MNADFYCPRLSPAESLSGRPESNQRAATEPMVPGPSFIHPGFLNAAAIRGILTGNYMRLSKATARLASKPSFPSKKRGGAFRRPASKGGVKEIQFCEREFGRRETSCIKLPILFLVDRNALIDQTKRGDFKHFKGKMTVIRKKKIDKAFEIYLALYQGLTDYNEDKDAYKQFSREFFDLIVADECHRGVHFALKNGG